MLSEHILDFKDSIDVVDSSDHWKLKKKKKKKKKERERERRTVLNFFLCFV